ncbi:MAG: hydroxymethylglutaryl-CoA lyase, partial [Pyramidobacter sp.]|nr:hydroxymethylglutaryl-CoA lyase [Pyramidobacter sp.]
MMDFVKEVTLCEVGPRDGLQNEKKIFTVEEKVELINASAKAGFPVIEVGSFVSPKAVPQMANTDDVFKALTPVPGVEYRALIANLKGVERAVACGCKKVKLNVSASKAHNLANLNSTPAESVAGFGACCDAAKAAGIGISGSISMAFGSPWDKEIPLSDVKEIVDAYLAVGVTEISLSDAS